MTMTLRRSKLCDLQQGQVTAVVAVEVKEVEVAVEEGEEEEDEVAGHRLLLIRTIVEATTVIMTMTRQSHLCR